MTKDIDLSTVTNNNEILSQFRDHLEQEINDIFLWAIGQTDITEMTKRIEKTNQARYRYTNYTHYFAYISHQRAQPDRFLRPKRRKWRIGSGCLETDLRSRKELRI